MSMRFIKTVLCAFAAAAAVGAAQAQAYPTKPITWIVPFAAGGPTDALARSIAERVARELGQPIVIDNSAGAGGTIGAAHAARPTATPCWSATWATWAPRRPSTRSSATIR
jgi:tripartite-type tricarboxylate transporter receptor subunit TctC